MTNTTLARESREYAKKLKEQEAELKAIEAAVPFLANRFVEFRPSWNEKEARCRDWRSMDLAAWREKYR